MRAFATIVAALATPAAAAVMSVTPAGFVLESRAIVAKQPDNVFAALSRVSAWWNGAHSYSGDAANLSVDLRAGGCWCEKLPGGGSVEHMHFVQVRPGQALVARGGLGPLQGQGVDAALTWTLTAVPQGTELRQTYIVGGYARPGLDKLAPVVDGVMSEAFARLVRYAETGSPTEKAGR